MCPEKDSTEFLIHCSCEPSVRQKPQMLRLRPNTIALIVKAERHLCRQLFLHAILKRITAGISLQANGTAPDAGG